MADEPKEGESKIVSAVGVSVNSSLGGPAGKDRSRAIEAAMQQAIIDATEGEGLNVDKDAAAIREKMMDARKRVIDSWAAPAPQSSDEQSAP